MKKFILISLFLFYSNTPLYAIDLKSAIIQSWAHVPLIQSLTEKANADKHQIDIAKSDKRPLVRFNALQTYGRFDNTSTRARGGDGFETNDSYRFDLTATQRLFDGYLTSGLVQNAAENYQASLSNILSNKEKLARQTMFAYVDVLRFQALVENAKINVSKGKDLLSIVNKQVLIGRTAKVDYFLAKTQVAASQAQLINQQDLLDNAKIRFTELTGLPAEGLVPLEAPPIPSTLQGALEQGMANHPEIERGKHAIEAAKASVKSQKSSRLPRIDLELFAQQGRDENAFLGKDRNYGANLVLQWDLYRGGRNIASEKKTINTLAEIQLKQDETYRQIKELIKQSWSKLNNEKSRLKYLKQQLAADKKVYMAYQTLLKAAKRSPLDVFVVLRNLNNSRLAANDVHFKILTQYFDVLASMGALNKLSW